MFLKNSLIFFKFVIGAVLSKLGKIKDKRNV